MELSLKTQNTLAEAKKAVQRVPERYRKELCTCIEGKLESPNSYVFRHSESIVIHSFHRIYTLYNLLCERDQEQFVTAFSELSAEFAG